jgi:hypothetical protein
MGETQEGVSTSKLSSIRPENKRETHKEKNAIPEKKDNGATTACQPSRRRLQRGILLKTRLVEQEELK